MSISLVIAALAAYSVFGLWLTLRSRRATTSGADDFYLAGRDMPGWLAAASYAATTYSAFMMLGLAGLTYKGGVGALGFELVYFAGLALLVIFAPRFWLVGKKFGFLTPAEMLGARYETPWLAKMVAALSCVFLIPYCAVQLLGIGYLLSGITDGAIPTGMGIILASILAAIWTLGAGLRSVAITDAVQAILMLISGAAALVAVIVALGGISAFMTAVETSRPAWLDQPGPGLFSLKTFIAFTVPWFFFSISNPQVSQRLFTIRDLGAIRTMIIGVLAFGLIFTIISVLWGYAGLVMLPDLSNPDLVTPTLLASNAIPTWIALPLVVGIFAAAITTVDSIALTLASMVGRDLAGHKARPRELAIGKATILIVIVAAAGFAQLKLNLISVLSVAASAGLLVIVPALIGAFFWRRGTGTGALLGTGGGALAVFICGPLGLAPLGLPYAIFAFLTAIILFIGGSLATKPPADRGHKFIDALRPELDRLNVD